jgi:Holliday junction resolvase
MGRKSKGMDAERELIHLFWRTGNWTAVRVAGSGAIKYPCPDVLAGNCLRRLAVECKSSKKRRKYLTDKEVKELMIFARCFGAEPWIGVRFDGINWFFLGLNELKKTKNGFVISEDLARKKGLLFEQLVEEV